MRANVPVTALTSLRRARARPATRLTATVANVMATIVATS